MKVGFTGTRAGMTPQQLKTTRRILRKLNVKNPITEIHHGGCDGADTEFHNLIFTLPHPPIVIVHPGPATETKLFEKQTGVKVLPRRPNLIRNHDIVDVADFMLGTPQTKIEKLRSGTWATIRYGLKIGNPPLLIWPDGSVNRKW